MTTSEIIGAISALSSYEIPGSVQFTWTVPCTQVKTAMHAHGPKHFKSPSFTWVNHNWCIGFAVGFNEELVRPELRCNNVKQARPVVCQITFFSATMWIASCFNVSKSELVAHAYIGMPKHYDIANHKELETQTHFQLQVVLFDGCVISNQTTKQSDADASHVYFDAGLYDCSLEMSNGVSVRAHRLMLAQHSEVLRKSFCSKMAEASDGIIKLPAGIEWPTLRLILRHIYSKWLPSIFDPIAPPINSDTVPPAKRLKSEMMHAAGLDNESQGSSSGNQHETEPCLRDAIQGPIEPWTAESAMTLYRIAQLYNLQVLATATAHVIPKTLGPEHMILIIQLVREGDDDTNNPAREALRQGVVNYIKENAASIVDGTMKLKRKL